MGKEWIHAKIIKLKNKSRAPAQVLQAPLCCLRFLYPQALPAHSFNLWISEVHGGWSTPGACPGWDERPGPSMLGSSSAAPAWQRYSSDRMQCLATAKECSAEQGWARL